MFSSKMLNTQGSIIGNTLINKWYTENGLTTPLKCIASVERD